MVIDGELHVVHQSGVQFDAELHEFRYRSYKPDSIRQLEGFMSHTHTCQGDRLAFIVKGFQPLSYFESLTVQVCLLLSGLREEFISTLTDSLSLHLCSCGSR